MLDARGRLTRAETAFAETQSFDDVPHERGSGVRDIDALADLPATIAERYEILGVFGTGGMGVVYRALDRALDECVALKVLHHALSRDAEALTRFRHEVRLARRVTHRNVARMFDFGEHDGLAYLTMEAIEGESLSERLARRGAFSAERAIAVALEVAAGLAAAHAAGVAHLDLKPDNILFDASERVVITDFGIAVALEALRGARPNGRIVGTPAYMAPEQLTRPHDLDQRVDVYALGLVLYEMLTGHLPWSGVNALEIARARLFEAPRDPRAFVATIPDDVAELVLASLARSPEERIASSDALHSMLLDLPSARPAIPSQAPPSVPKLYAEAREAYHDFWRTSESVALFERALARAPHDARTLAGSSLALSRATGMDVDTLAARRAARERAELALQIAPGMPEPHVALAVAHGHEGDFESAAIHLRRALQASPLQADALEHSARMLLETHALDDGVAYAARAIEVEPRTKSAIEQAVVRAHALLGNWDEVERAFRTRPEGGGARLSYWLTRIRLAIWRNDPGEKRRVQTELAADAFPHKTFPLLYARFLAPDMLGCLERQFIDDRTESATCSLRQRTFFRQLAVEVAAIQAEVDVALDALDAAVGHGLFDAAWIDRCPALAPLRAHPRFVLLREEVSHRAELVARTLLSD